MSEDRKSHVAHLFLERLQELNAIEDKDRGQVLRKTKAYLDKAMRDFELAQDRAEKKVQSTKKNLVVGSRDYVTQVERVFLEEIRKV